MREALKKATQSPRSWSYPGVVHPPSLKLWRDKAAERLVGRLKRPK